jgi:molecular chaperone DnaK (HSP70)
MELAKKLYPKLRVFAPVVVRGEEDKGVRFYEFGKMVYQELLGVMADEDYGDITDIQKGRDITIEVIPAAETGKMFNTTTIRVKPNQTPLVKDANAVEEFLNNQKELVSLFKKYTFEEMKDELQGWLKPADEDGGKETEVKAAPSKQKENIDSKLDSLFD